MIGKNKNAKQRKASEIWLPVRPKILKSMLFGVVAAICSIGSVITIAYIIKALVANSSQIPYLLLLLLFLLTAVNLLFSLRSGDLSHFASFDLEEIIRKRIAKKVTQLPLGTILNNGTGTFTKVMQDDVKNLHAYVADSPTVTVKAIITPLIIAVVLFFYSWQLTTIFLVIFILLMLGVSLMMSNFKDMFERFNKAKEQVNEAIVEFVQAMPVVRMFDNGSSSFGRYKKALDEYTQVMVDWGKKSAKMSKGSTLILNPFGSLLIIIWAGLFLLYHDSLSFNAWLIFLLLATGLVEAILPYMMLSSGVQQSKMSIERIFEIEDMPTLPISKEPKTITRNDIQFNQVSFKYQDTNVLEDLNFHLPENSFTAIVGASGSGKSTIARLIPRFWDVNQGEISIGGVDIKQVLPNHLMEHVSFVFQDNFLFQDTVANNISYGLSNISEEEIIKAAKLAQAHEFIEKLPQGYQTLVGERGTNISGGQKQRITIARAMLQNRPILILDEATAHSDPENEALLIQAIASLMEHKTVLMIAHRLSTIVDADQILVLEKGRLVEMGKHQALLDNQATYARLWASYQQAQNWQYNH